MKKNYLIIAVLNITLAANAQIRKNIVLPQLGKPLLSNSIAGIRATGDTVSYFDGESFSGSGISSASVPPFNLANDDIDGFTVDASLAADFGPTSAFKFLYVLNSVTGDTNKFIGATSYFDPVGTSDNWFSFGPVSIPAAGANLFWKHNIMDVNYSDGYKVFVSTTGLSNYNDFTGSPIFTVADMDPSTTTDTATTPDLVFYERSASLAAYASQSIYIGFQHQAADKFLLYLDDIAVIEGTASVNEFVNGAKLFQNMPNPSNGVSVINYEIEKNAAVVLSVFDITGKKVAEQNAGEQNAGTHSISFNSDDLAAGVYTYSLTIGKNTSSTMKMVVIK